LNLGLNIHVYAYTSDIYMHIPFFLNIIISYHGLSSHARDKADTCRFWEE
jgi:hypothetical protein